MFTPKEINQITKRLPAAHRQAKKAPPKLARALPAGYIAPPQTTPDEDDEFIPVGIGGLLAASEKLLAVNRGLTDPDERDSYVFKQLFGVDRHLAQRIKLDAGRVRQGLMRNSARFRALRAAHPFMFDGYSQGLLIGDPQQANPLSSPLEEINPLHIVEQQRRVTQMGPGGIGSPEAITPAAQAVHPSQFGFISAIEGPECHDADTDVFTRRGWVPWPMVTDTDQFACLIGGRMEFHRATRVVREPYTGEMLTVISKCLDICVTPNHRMRYRKLGSSDMQYYWAAAQDLYGKPARLLTCHQPYAGEYTPEFVLPAVQKGSNAQLEFPPMLMDDWAELLGWYLGEGSVWIPEKFNIARSCVKVTQSMSANPEKVNRIAQLLGRLPFAYSFQAGVTFHLCGKQLIAYLAQFGKSSDRFIPECMQHVHMSARQKIFEALILAEARRRLTGKKVGFVSTSKQLADDFERIAVSLGYPTSRAIEKDSRPHVTSTNYRVSLLFTAERVTTSADGRNYWGKRDYNGLVYCATVPGSLLYTRRSGKSGVWTGNSERIGIDTRLATGARIGSDGRIYQQFRNARTGQTEWVSPEDLEGKVVSLPS